MFLLSMLFFIVSYLVIGGAMVVFNQAMFYFYFNFLTIVVGVGTISGSVIFLTVSSYAENKANKDFEEWRLVSGK